MQMRRAVRSAEEIRWAGATAGATAGVAAGAGWRRVIGVGATACGRGRAGAANGLVLKGVGPPDDVPCVGSITMLFFGRIRDGLMLGRALKPAGVRLPSSVMDVLEVLTMTVLAWSVPRGDPALCVQVGIVCG